MVKPRRFDECGPLNPLQAEFDLDAPPQSVHLGALTSDGDDVQLQLEEAGPFRFLSPKGEETARFDLSGRGEAQIFALRDAVAGGAGSSGDPVALKGALTVWRLGARPLNETLHASVKLYRSGPVTPVARIVPETGVDLSGELPADRHVRLGTILLQPQEPIFESRVDARIRVAVKIRAAGAGTATASLRVHQLGEDEGDRGWQTSDGSYEDWLQLDLQEHRFTTDEIEFGIAYEALCQLVGAAGPSAAKGATIQVEASVDLIKADGTSLALARESTDLVVRGYLGDSIAFSICGGSPHRLALQPAEVPAPLPFPKLFARRHVSRRGVQQLAMDPLEISVASAAQPVELRINISLVSGNRSRRLSNPKIVHLSTHETKNVPLDWPPDLVRDFDTDPKAVVAATVLISAVFADADGKPAETAYSFESSIELEQDPAEWQICVDFGTSSTAIWIGRSATFSEGHRLRLGHWLSRIDKTHPESAIWDKPEGKKDAKDTKGTDPLYSYLLPSYVGLSADINLRADWDPLSLGSLESTLPGDDAVKLRLDRLKRSYDVSVPFPSSQLLPQYVGAVVSELKKKMILRSDHFKISERVFERSDSGRIEPVSRVALARLVEDCFAELGGYIALSVLEQDAASSEVAAKIAEALLTSSDRFGVIVTHPCGIDQRRRDVYRRSGDRFLRSFLGGEDARHGGVKLVPEALASARYGIADYQERNAEKAAPERTFVTVDIGAGTYDISVIKVVSEPKSPGWSLRSHFGVAIGGTDLDTAIIDRILTVLRSAGRTPSVTDAFEIDLDALEASRLPFSADQNRASALLRLELQAAKARLTQRLFAAENERYDWADRKHSGPALDIKIGRPGAASDEGWLVRQHIGDASRDLAPFAAELRTEKDQDGVEWIRLRLWRDVFDTDDGATGERLSVLTEIMGRELPRLAIAGNREPGERPIVIVTGRAALWPPLYAAIQRTAAEMDAVMAQSKPFPPDEMKLAVVRGAMNIPPEILDDEVAIENPIALIKLKIDISTSKPSGATRTIDEITVLDVDRKRSQTVETRGPFLIARIIPGIDLREGSAQRLALFRQLYNLTGIKPFVELSSKEFMHPKRGPPRPATWNVTWSRDISGLTFTFEGGAGPPIEIGPFGGGRTYGSE
jgi:hypothetical protein